MPKAKIVIYQEAVGKVPLIEWLESLSRKAQDKCIAKVELLAEQGNSLRRPHCDLLEDGLYELRVRTGHVQYRILYAYIGKQVVLLSHGCQKEKTVPPGEIQKALDHLKKYKAHPTAHTYSEEL